MTYYKLFPENDDRVTASAAPGPDRKMEENQLQLFPEKDEFEPRPGRGTEETHLHLILEDSNDVAKWRRRSAFLAAVLVEVVFIVFLAAVSPYIRRHAALMQAIAEQEHPHQEATFLVMPRDLEKELRKPKTNILSDKNRLARGPSPVVKPNGIAMPRVRGNTHLPTLAGGAPPKPAVRAPAPALRAAAPTPPVRTEEAQNTPPPKPEEKPEISLSDVKPPPSKVNPLIAQQLGMASPAQAIQQPLQDAGQSMGQVPGPGDSMSQLNNMNPNFSTSGPIILSDTRGVNFGPYLAQILMIVRQNWYAVIPESARLGEKGRVAIVFEIVKDGSVPQLRLVGSSGRLPLDRAAEAGIRASIPFPPLPSEFTGRHLVLQFNFFYNMNP
ncbi:MAG: TonB family protein [Terriglobia bacterium]